MIRLKPLAEQTIVITGASSGIGRVTALAAARRGARLVLTGRDEAALFHLLNLARERKCPVLLTSGAAIDQIGLTVADLRSRLRLAPGVAIREPDDALLRAVIVKLFVDRQLVVDLRVIDAVALRIDRSLGRAREVVTELDRDALGRGRRITRPLALAVLERLGIADGGDDEDD